MQITALQWDIAWEDPAANATRVAELLAANKPQPGGLVILPEMFATGYSMDVSKIAEPINPDQPDAPNALATACLQSIATQYQVTVIGGVVSQQSDGMGRNDALVVGPDGRPLTRYTKMNPMTLCGEAEHYVRGDEIVTFDWPNPNATETRAPGAMRVAPFICYDLRFPELFRVASLERGAELMVVIASFPTVRHEHWRPLLIARAIENQAYVVGVNRCGTDPNLSYAGGSVVIDPLGAVIAEAGADDCALQADIDPKAPDRFRQKLPALKDAWFGR